MSSFGRSIINEKHATTITVIYNSSICKPTDQVEKWKKVGWWLRMLGEGVVMADRDTVDSMPTTV